ncbi:unnamed protein product [Darwinula stevensoni]|uniref:Uncharacterized protein n=1 Tax=Darwinula stevensoni TaxID=69355 RepID=A0A7R9AEC2_9CRUS|nr:unnamed protein product [Darwinula stevensoni]CAG0901317.1 unnamed protein product [Darwinula stevensoni]
MRWFAGCLPPVRGTAKGQQEKLESVVSLPYNRLEETRFDSPATYGSIESETKCAHGVIYRYCTRDHDDGADVDPGEHCHLDLPTLTDKNARKRLIVASVLCLFFMVLEIVGGFLSRSLAVATDAAHLLTDFASFMISLFSIWLSKRPATKQLSFGWHRAEVIGAMTSVLMIWVITGVIVYMAAERLATGQYDVQPTIMLITSGVGILVNIITFCRTVNAWVYSEERAEMCRRAWLHVGGGFLSRSLAVATDAAHLLTDFASFMISLFSIWLSKRPATKQLSFGWHRAEVIGAMTSVLMIWVITGVIVYMAAERLATGQYDVQPTIMLITSGVGILVNIILGLTLHQHDSHGGHKHDSHGGHKHGNEDPEASCGGRESDGDAAEHATPGVSVHGVSRRHRRLNEPKADPKFLVSRRLSRRGIPLQPKRNINVSAALIHVVGDFIQSVGVFVAALIIYFKCGIPRGIRFDEVEKLLLSIDGVVKIHNLHVWCLSLERMAMAAHVVILPGHSHQSILKEAIARLGRKYKFFVTTLQIEEFKDSMIDCGLCNEKPKD